jgi:hypothetical protein
MPWAQGEDDVPLLRGHQDIPRHLAAIAAPLALPGQYDRTGHRKSWCIWPLMNTDSMIVLKPS